MLRLIYTEKVLLTFLDLFKFLMDENRILIIYLIRILHSMLFNFKFLLYSNFYFDIISETINDSYRIRTLVDSLQAIHIYTFKHLFYLTKILYVFFSYDINTKFIYVILNIFYGQNDLFLVFAKRGFLYPIYL